MPLYEYKCIHCGETHSKIQKYEDKPVTHCPFCNNETLQKLFSAPQFTLLGMGYYKRGTF